MNNDGDRYVQRIEIPASENLELHVDGFRYWGKVENSSGADFTVGVWDSAGAAIEETVIDSSQQYTQMGSTPYNREYMFDTTVTMTSGTVYYMGFEKSEAGASNSLTVSYLQPGGLDGLKSWPGQDAFYASFWDESASSWTDDNTKRLLLNPILSSIHGTGGGGSTISGPSMGVIG